MFMSIPQFYTMNVLCFWLSFPNTSTTRESCIGFTFSHTLAIKAAASLAWLPRIQTYFTLGTSEGFPLLSSDLQLIIPVCSIRSEAYQPLPFMLRPFASMTSWNNSPFTCKASLNNFSLQQTTFRVLFCEFNGHLISFTLRHLPLRGISPGSSSLGISP